MEDKQELKIEIDTTVLCVSCLCVGRKLGEIKNENLQRFYLDAVTAVSMNTTPLQCPHICWECLALLKKAVSFREQVQNSCRILQIYTNENLKEHLISEVIRQPSLSNTTLDCVDIQPNLTELQAVFVKDEVKSDWSVEIDTNDHLNEFDQIEDNPNDIIEENVVISKHKGIKKKINNNCTAKVKKRKRLKNVRPYETKNEDRKIKSIQLSYEEMLKLREEELSKQSFISSEFKCESCITIFTCEVSYKKHVKEKHSLDIGQYVCPICKTVLITVESFTSHCNRHLRQYECVLCNTRGTDKKVLQQHYAAAHGNGAGNGAGAYTCEHCGKISHSLDSHRYHKECHKPRIKCMECDKTFSHRAGVLNHRLVVHEKQNSFKCNKCEKKFKWKASLKRHLELNHRKVNNESAYCTPCGVSFSSVASYQRHMKNSLKHVSQDQLRYICDECNKRFADKTKLRDHIEEKHLHRTYQCHICCKPSKNRVSLDQHIRNVHKGRPNNKICHHCGKGFPTKIQLDSHIRSHTGERPFICEHCPTTFSQQSNLYKHNRQVHLNIKSKRYPKRLDEKLDEKSVNDPTRSDNKSELNKANFEYLINVNRLL